MDTNEPAAADAPAIAGPDELVSAGAATAAKPEPTTVITRRPEPTQGQRILNRLLAARSEQLTAVVAIDRSIAAMRKGSKRGEDPPAPRPPETAFFDALEQLAADFEQVGKRLTAQAQELRERF